MTSTSPTQRGRERIVVAISGGIDSAMAAALLQAAGHEVIAITLRLQACAGASAGAACCAGEGLERARATCAFLGVPHYEMPCAAAFEAEVLRPAWDEYARGRTPSPCLLCNERIKFPLLAARAREIGAARLATGHYARIEPGPCGEPHLLRGKDAVKDQSYFLAGLEREQLRGIVFPLGSFTKREVRALAAERGLPCAHAPESQDACFQEEGRCFAELLRVRFGVPARPGVVIDDDGAVLGPHAGIHRFTIGQRRALGIAARGRRWVRRIDAATNTVHVTRDEERLLSRVFTASGIRWAGGEPPAPGRRCLAQLRSRHVAATCGVEPLDAAAARVTLDAPVRAATPGQAVVFYDEDTVIGRGWLDAIEDDGRGERRVGP